MDEKTLALIVALVDEAVNKIELPESLRGPRGFRGQDGNIFVLEDHKKSLIDFISSNIPKFELSDEQRSELKGDRGDRGEAGRAGLDGKDFSFEEHRDVFEEIINKYSLKFEDLTQEQLESLRGRNGKDGKDFDFEEYREAISNIVKAFVIDISDTLKIRFSDLTDEERESLIGGRGPRGLDGKDFDFEESKERISNIIGDKVDSIKPELKLNFEHLTDEERESLKGDKGDRGPRGLDGKDFDFEESKEHILNIISDKVDSIKPELKLNFEHLTDEEKNSLEGKRGQRGKPGKDFDFEESKEKISNIISDKVESIKPDLGLKFENLTVEEKDSLRFKFEHFTDEQWYSLRGARGQRGKKGYDGPQGEKGDKGEKGDVGKDGKNAVGTPGKNGKDGQDGIDGIDGIDAPRLEKVTVDQTNKDITFNFEMSDGETITSNKVTIPKSQTFTQYIGGIGGGGSTDLATVMDSFLLLKDGDNIELLFNEDSVLYVNDNGV